jgi:hypothetical protein
MKHTTDTKHGGGKLSRSEVVTVRFDPKLRFALELASRRQRRTVSSFIEWVVAQAIMQEKLSPEQSSSLTIDDIVRKIWDVQGSKRLANLADNFPELLTHEEELLLQQVNSI